MLGAAPTLESNYWFGAQGNRLWIGQVECDGAKTITEEKCVDYQESNRVKVRIMGYHTRSRDTLPSLDLPWATVLMPTTESITRFGSGATHGLENGMWVLGTFMDGESAQQPLVMGSIGIVDKRQDTYEDRVKRTAGNNDLASSRPDTTENNKASTGGHGPSNRGQNTGTKSTNDTTQQKNEKQTLTIANGKCGPRPESDFAKIFNDLFQSIDKNDKIGTKLVDKTTGNITESAALISTYVGRLGAAASSILGDIKQLVLNEFQKYFKEYIITPITTALALSPTKKSPSIWVADELGDALLEILKCLFKTVFEEVLNLILDIVTGIIDDFLNTAFCMVSDVIQSITSQISSAIDSALGAFSSIASLISEYGDWAGSWVKKVGDLIAQFCDGQLSCIIGTGAYDTKGGEIPDNSVDAFFNGLETFGGLPNETNVGLFGSDSFLSTFENTQIIGSDGKVAQGTLDCSKTNTFAFPSIPDLFFTGLEYIYDDFIGDFPGPFPSTYSSGSNYPRAIPAIDSSGKVAGCIVTNPGKDLSVGLKASIIPYRGWGGNAVIQPVIKDGKVSDVIVINPGGGYPYFNGSDLRPKIPEKEDGQPDYDKIKGIHTENEYWLGIITPNNPPLVINAGQNLDETCGIIVEPDPNEVYEVVLPELEPVIVNGRLISVKVVKEGFGFSTLPKMYVGCTGNVNAGDQKRAVIKPSVQYIPRKNAKDYLNLFEDYRDVIDCVGYPGDN